MIAVNTRVLVIPSTELYAMRLARLEGRTGRVVEMIFGAGEKPLGYMVCLDEPFEDECLWFVPENTVGNEEGHR